MKSTLKKISSGLTILLAATAAGASVARSQTITPAPDGTGTLVTPSGDRIDISGGSLSKNGANLFHSFLKFGLSPAQIANFLSNPSIRNILGRITGGDPSVINGLIRVSGGNANLFLINPSGIVFGNNARLDLRGSFTATTANGIGFGDNWFSATGANDYANLVGTPTTFAFNTSNPGSIINTGDLTVASGQNLTLLGGTVVSTGNLSAPDGNIIVSAVPGESLVRLTPKGNLLSLEIQPLGSDRPNNSSLPVASLPQLLTGGQIAAADGIKVNANGQVELTSSGIDINNGDVAVTNNVTSRQATLSANRNLTLVESQIRTTGDLNLLAGNTVLARDRAANPFVALAGGRLLLQGNQKVDLLVLNHSQSGLFSGGNMVLRSANTIGGDAHYWAGGNFRIEKLDGSVGNLFSPYDPVILAVGDVTLGDYTGASLGIAAGGRVQLGNVNITAVDPLATSFPDITITLPNGQVTTINIANQPGLVVLAGMKLDPLFSALGLPPGNVVIPPGSTSPIFGSPTSADIQTGNISFAAPNGVVFLSNANTSAKLGASSFTLEANTALPGGNIQTGTIDTSDSSQGGNVILSARKNINTGSIVTRSSSGNGGQIGLLSLGGNIDTTAGILESDGGAIALTANGNVTTGDIFSEGDRGKGGNISITSQTGEIDTTQGELSADGIDGDGGDVSLTAFGAIRTGDITSLASITGLPGVPPTNAGNITLTSSAGSVTTGNLGALGEGNNNGGAVSINASGNITTGGIVTASLLDDDVLGNGNGGAITLTSQVGDIQVLGIATASGANGTGGDVNINAGRFFRVTDSFTLQNGVNFSILTAGGKGSGNITIRYGGNGSTPFIVGDPRVNGTAGAIISDFNNTIAPLQSFPGNFTQGNINILANSSLPPTTNVPPIAKTIEQPQPQPPLPNSNIFITSNLDNLKVDTIVGDLEVYFTNQFNQYFKRSIETSFINLTDARSALRQIERETGVKPAIIYAVFTPDKAVPGTVGQAQTEQDSDLLDLVIVTGSGNPIRKQIPGATRAKVKEVADRFYAAVSEPNQAKNNNYLAPSQQLYQWLFAPLDEDLQKQKIQNVMFISDVGLRSLPLAALHDGKQFAIEKYSLGLAPSLSLTDTRYVNIRNSEVLAMGAGEFAPDQEQDPLLAAPLEVSTVATKVWRGRSLVDRDFTENNLKGQRQRRPFGIVHLATHANFETGEPSNSYIQLYDMKVPLDRARELGLNNPGTQLLVLSACRSALGDKNAELGFAGLSVQAGVKSALASLWDVSDSGALALMSEFYQQLNTAPIKAEALRRAQVAMIAGKVKIEGNELITSTGSLPLSPEVATYLRRNTVGELSHPFYWASFTLVGSPW